MVLAQALQIPHERQFAVALTPPTQVQIGADPHLNLHGLPLAGKAPKHSAPTGLESEIRKTGRQHLGVPQDGWQDGEVGHGTDARVGRP